MEKEGNVIEIDRYIIRYSLILITTITTTIISNQVPK